MQRIVPIRIQAQPVPEAGIGANEFFRRRGDEVDQLLMHLRVALQYLGE